MLQCIVQQIAQDDSDLLRIKGDRFIHQRSEGNTRRAILEFRCQRSDQVAQIDHFQVQSSSRVPHPGRFQERGHHGFHLRQITAQGFTHVASVQETPAEPSTA
jgi:hypothetical protein